MTICMAITYIIVCMIVLPIIHELFDDCTEVIMHDCVVGRKFKLGLMNGSTNKSIRVYGHN